MGLFGLVLTLIMFGLFLIALVPAWYKAYFKKEETWH